MPEAQKELSIRLIDLEDEHLREIGEALDLLDADVELNEEHTLAFLSELVEREKFKGEQANAEAVGKLEGVILSARIFSSQPGPGNRPTEKKEGENRRFFGHLSGKITETISKKIGPEKNWARLGQTLENALDKNEIKDPFAKEKGAALVSADGTLIEKIMNEIHRKCPEHYQEAMQRVEQKKAELLDRSARGDGAALWAIKRKFPQLEPDAIGRMKREYAKNERILRELLKEEPEGMGLAGLKRLGYSLNNVLGKMKQISKNNISPNNTLLYEKDVKEKNRAIHEKEKRLGRLDHLTAQELVEAGREAGMDLSRDPWAEIFSEMARRLYPAGQAQQTKPNLFVDAEELRKMTDAQLVEMGRKKGMDLAGDRRTEIFNEMAKRLQHSGSSL
ncbi:Uncharacterised protein [uncultured archaeon]|nr:Uncharacterised protein [uncultured archaeon]